MESDDIWKAFQLGINLCHFLCGSPYGFNLDSRTLYYNKPTKLHFRVLVYLKTTCLLLYTVICLVNIIAPIFFGIVLLKNFNSIAVNLTSAVVSCELCIPSLVLYFSPSGTCGIVNRLGPIKPAVSEVYKRDQPTGNASIMKLTAFCIRLMIFLTMCPAVMAGLFLVYFDLDPLGPLVEMTFSKINTSELLKNLCMFLIRYTAILVSIMEAACSAILYIPGAIVMLITLNNSITRITELATNPKELSWKGVSFTPATLKTIKIYKMIQVYLAITEPIYSAEIPVLIFCGSLLAIVCNYATIKFYYKVALPVYICAPILSLFVVIMIVTLVPQAGEVYEKCCTFRRVLKSTAKSKMQQAVVKSLKPFGMNATFFVVKASVRSKIVEYQMYYTMTLLLSGECSS